MVQQPKSVNSEFTKQEKSDFIAWYDNNKDKIIAPKKYYKAQKSMVIEETQKLFANNPQLSIKEVILQIISSLPDFLPGSNLVKIVKYIVTTWEQENFKNSKA